MNARILKLQARKKMLFERGETMNYKLIRKIDRNIRKEQMRNEKSTDLV